MSCESFTGHRPPGLSLFISAQLKRHYIKSALEQPCKIHLTPQQELWLKLNFPHMATKICALILGISHRSVIRQARRLGVVKTEQFMKECIAHTCKKAKESHLKNGTYPQKGYYSPNLQKGQKYQFKPGHKPIKPPF